MSAVHGRIEVRGDDRRGYGLRPIEAVDGPALYTADTLTAATEIAVFLSRVASVGASPALRAWVRANWETGEAEEERSLDLFAGGNGAAK